MPNIDMKSSQKRLLVYKPLVLYHNTLSTRSTHGEFIYRITNLGQHTMIKVEKNKILLQMYSEPNILASQPNISDKFII